MSLILRFYDVNAGRILLDGKDIRSYDVGALRKSMGLVMQEPTLFNYTISENILYGDMRASNTAVKEAAKAANALEFIEGSETIEGGFEDTGIALFNAVQSHEAEVKAMVGTPEYNEIIVSLEKIRQAEQDKG